MQITINITKNKKAVIQEHSLGGHCVKSVQIRTRKNSIFGHFSHRVCFVKKSFFFVKSLYCGHWFICSRRKHHTHRRLIFSQVSLLLIKHSFSTSRNLGVLVQEISSEEVLYRAFSYSTEQLHLPGHCKKLPVSSLRIKKNTIIFSESKQIPQRNTSFFLVVVVVVVVVVSSSSS